MLQTKKMNRRFGRIYSKMMNRIKNPVNSKLDHCENIKDKGYFLTWFSTKLVRTDLQNTQNQQFDTCKARYTLGTYNTIHVLQHKTSIVLQVLS